MANIKQYLDEILKAVFGRDVRQSIHDGIDAINEDVIENTTLSNNIKTRQDMLEQKYDEQIKNIAASEPQNAEIVDARQGFDTLGLVIKQKVYHFENVEDMKNCLTLMLGDTCQTLGYYSANDGGEGLYKIVNDDTLVDDSGSIHELANGLKAKLVIKDDRVNVKQFGAKGDGETDDSDYFKEDKQYEANRGVFQLDKNTLLHNIKTKNITGTGSLKYKAYNYKNNDGIIPIKKIKDNVFLSMNLPSDGNTYMINRINGNLISPNLSEDDINIHAIGAVYKNSDLDLPETFNLYLGKIKLFGYRQTTGHWEILKEDSVPAAIRRYKLPWTTNESYDVDYIFDENKQMYKITLTKEDFSANENAEGYVLHFWGNNYVLTTEDYTDITKLASCMECMVESTSNQNISSQFLGVCAIDRTQSSQTFQVGYSRNVAINNYVTKIWFHNVNNTEYDLLETSQLDKLFDANISNYKTLYEDKTHNSLGAIHLNDNIVKYKMIEIFYSFKRTGFDETQYSTKIVTNNAYSASTILTTEAYSIADDITSIVINKKQINLNNENIGYSNSFATVKKLDFTSSTEEIKAVYANYNSISINKVVGYI